MKFKFLSIAIAASAMLSGCATTPLQYRKVLQEHGGLPSAQLIQNVEFKDQPAGSCGPVTLSMAMQASGKSISPEVLAGQMLTPGLNGSLQEDLVGSARRNGMLAIPVRNFNDLLVEISAGHPVIVFENLGLDWYPQWHYALVLGFDFPNQEVIMHSGHTPYLHESMKVFENSWKLSDYWALVILPLGELASSGNEREHVKAAVALEGAAKPYEAAIVYESILKKWPDSLVAAIGLSNIYFTQGKKMDAKTLLLKSQRFHPESEAIRNNLAVIAKAASR